jgi:hypothetical protein
LTFDPVVPRDIHKKQEENGASLSVWVPKRADIPNLTKSKSQQQQQQQQLKSRKIIIRWFIFIPDHSE